MCFSIRLTSMNNSKTNKLETAQNYAISHGGELLSNEYVNNKEKMLWKCNNPEHPKWYATYDNCVNKKSWCMLCSGKAKPTVEEGLKKAQQYAYSHGGQCLSTNYVTENKKVTLEWKCNNIAHSSWFGTVDNVIHKKTWCAKCEFENQKEQKKDSQGLKKCQDYAASRGGLCLSSEYINQNTNLEWKCSNHEHKSWFALPKIVNRETWCSLCSKEKKKHA